MARRRTFARDICLISAFLLIACVSLLVNRSCSSTGEWAGVKVNGVETARYSLSENGTYVLNGGTNVLEIRDGQARMTEADCPNHLCVKQGPVRYSGQSIVCLPNKVTVTLTGGKGTYDFVQ